ncbi:LysR family transcriptional regulator [Burkholderia sp. F1]|uniref:LysR family transcriptional regulator n=1 Tax=Burkholderia sp. F1 TaxID=3366817 RepID=UPI003D733397
MNVALLEIFCAVVREGSTLRAAEKLGCSQPNITSRIRQLEESLGTPLFERQGKRLVLNDAGRRLIPYGDRILRLIQEAERAVLEKPLTQTLRLGAMESTAATRLPHILAMLKREQPELTISVEIGSELVLLDRIESGQLDAALTARTKPREGFRYHPAFNEEVVVISAPGIGRNQLFTSGTTTLFAFKEGCPYRVAAQAWLREQGIRDYMTVALDSYSAIINSVVVNMGVAVVPRNVAAEHMVRNELIAHKFANLKEVPTYLITKHADRPDLEVELLERMLTTGSTRIPLLP